jgi:hypothetical protein
MASQPDFQGFARIAPYLSDPLVLVGFALMLLYGLFYALISSGLIPPLAPEAGGRIVQSILDYGFYAVAAVILLGFAHAHFRRQPRRSGNQRR